MPFCSTSGSQIPEESVFYLDCGKTIALVAILKPPPYVTLEKPKLSRSSLKLGAVSTIMLLVGIGIGYGIHPSPPHIDERRFYYG